MIIHSLTYIVLLFISVVVFLGLKKESDKKFFLLIISILFFLSFSIPATILVILSTILSYSLINSKQFKLAVSINLIILIAAKFMEHQYQQLGFIPFLGVAFYTLQNIRYIMEVANEEVQNYSLIDYTVWTLFFSKQVAGPILSPERSFKLNRPDIRGGFERIFLGLIKKLVIADRLKPIVDNVFLYPGESSGMAHYIAVILFFVQLYFDFSGYVDIAIGSGKLFGFKMPENFNLPLRSKTVSEFWRRWHMSLMNWLIDHIYYPLSFYFRKSKVFYLTLPISLVFLASGWWSGFEAKYTITVLLFAFFVIFESFLKIKSPKSRWKKTLTWFISFHLLAFAFSIFGSNNLTTALSIHETIWNNFTPSAWLEDVIAPLANGGDLNDVFNLITTIVLTLVFLIAEPFIQRSKWTVTKWTIGILIFLLFANFSETTHFIYMQF